MSMVLALSSDNVLLVEGFASSSDVAALLCAFRTVVAAQSSGHHLAEVKLHSSRTEVSCRSIATLCDSAIAEQLTKVRDRAIRTMKEFFQVPAELPEFTLATEMRTGDYHPLHADAVV